jgi:hypothetical protein
MHVNAVESTEDSYQEYPIVIVSNSDQANTRINAVARRLLKRLSEIAAHDPSMSLSVENPSDNPEESACWAITAKSSGRSKRYLLKEFCLPSTKGPRSWDYLVWILRAPVRAANYVRSRVRESVESGSRLQKAGALVRMLPKSVIFALQILSFFYLMPLISLTVIGPLRRWSLRITTVYLLFVATLIVVGTWRSFLPSFIARIGQFTQEIADLLPGTSLTFTLLFPVIASITIGALVSIVVFILRAIIQAMRRADARTVPAHGPAAFAYLLDPLYSAAVRRGFEKMVLEAGNKKETSTLFVVCEHGGILLAYEVLSRICPEKMNRPVQLLTRRMDLAGLAVGLRAMLWLLVEPNDWLRFGRATPQGLSWHHWLDLPGEECIFKIDQIRQDRLPQVRSDSVNKAWFRSSHSMLVERLIALADQT